VARVELDGARPRWRFKVWRDETLLASGELAIVESCGAAA
jgi:hypothetical protein